MSSYPPKKRCIPLSYCKRILTRPTKPNEAPIGMAQRVLSALLRRYLNKSYALLLAGLTNLAALVRACIFGIHGTEWSAEGHVVP